ncbi:dsRBD fold-containing protein [Nostocoides sp. F2B08]|uniref:dsRBD fold-containing protein n=1 Tax=Nostocoides sp. F2B08 TaxID=2653936 RepID=UPI00186B3F69|nr:dsRBD fold-containing protein [Tetrasphaera sp. F2B08]
MRAKPGDHIILAGELVNQPVRAGEVLEARGADGGPPYVVRWEDGHESTMFPGPGAALRVTGSESENAPEHHTDLVARPELGTSRQWNVRITIFEKGDDTTATVALLADSPEALTAKGISHRSSEDDTDAHIGDEVAVARALRHLADQLITTAEHDIEEATGEVDVMVRPR